MRAFRMLLPSTLGTPQVRQGFSTSPSHRSCLLSMGAHTLGYPGLVPPFPGHRDAPNPALPPTPPHLRGPLGFQVNQEPLPSEPSSP